MHVQQWKVLIVAGVIHSCAADATGPTHLWTDWLAAEAAHPDGQTPFCQGALGGCGPQHHLWPVVLHGDAHMPANTACYRQRQLTTVQSAQKTPIIAALHDDASHHATRHGGVALSWIVPAAVAPFATALSSDSNRVPVLSLRPTGASTTHA